MKDYISKKGQEAILNFKYKGGSVSYSYKYLWSPIADFCLDKLIPINWAPNLITFIGTIIQLIGWFFLAIQYPIDKKPQPFTILFFSICLFIYQTMDNIDGKQARRTNTSSPLGMLFDHGCDALGSIFMAFSVGRILLISDQRTLILGCFLGIILGFYFSVWTQYHSGGIMILGRINAIDDGIPMAWIIGIITFFIGQDLYNQIGILDYKYNQLFVGFVIFAQIFQVASLIKNTKGQFSKNRKLAFYNLIHIGFTIISMLCITQLTDWYIQEKYFYQIYFSICIPFIRDITYMQICVVSQQKYNQCQLPVYVFSIAYPLYIILAKNGIVLCDQKLFVNGMCIFFIVQYLHFVISVVLQLSRILKIKIFTISQQKIKQAKLKINGQKQKQKQKKRNKNL